MSFRSTELASPDITAWGDMLLRTPVSTYRVGTYSPFNKQAAAQTIAAKRGKTPPPRSTAASRRQQQRNQQAAGTAVRGWLKVPASGFETNVEQMLTQARTLNRLTITSKSSPNLTMHTAAEPEQETLQAARGGGSDGSGEGGSGSSSGNAHMSFAPAAVDATAAAASSSAAASAAGGCGHSGHSSSDAGHGDDGDDDGGDDDGDDGESEEGDGAGRAEEGGSDDQEEEDREDVERRQRAARVAQAQRQAQRQYGWATTIPSHAGERAKWNEVVLSRVAPPTPLSRHATAGIPGDGLVRQSASPVTPLHGSAHFFLTTGIQPHSLLPKPPPPPQARRKMGEKKGDRAEHRRLEAKRRAEANAALFRQVMDRVKRETPPPVREEAPPPAPAAAAAAAAAMEGGTPGRWTPWAGPRGAAPAEEVEETLAAIRLSNDRLRATVAYAQRQSFHLQSRLGVGPGAAFDDDDDEHAGAYGSRARQRAKAASTTRPRRPESASSSYLYPRGAGEEPVAGADFVAVRPYSAVPASPSRLAAAARDLISD